MGTITLVAAVVTGIIAAIGVWYARRAAVASEEENAMFRKVQGAQQARARPLVEVRVHQVDVMGQNGSETRIAMRAAFENQSSVTETLLEAWLTEVGGGRWGSVRDASVPTQLRTNVPIELRLEMRVYPPVMDAASIRARFASFGARFANYGEVSVPLPVS